MLNAVRDAFALAFSMTWEITWALILGFFLSAAVQAVVHRQTITRLLGDDRPQTLVKAAGLGAASSSCSYAAVALARSLFRKGASFTAAMAFEIASTNLVIELGIILILLMGWQFALGEFVGGPIMIVVIALLFRMFLSPRLLEAARRQAERGRAGSMEGHAAMDMSVTGTGSVWRRLASAEGLTSVSHIFVMEWAAVIRDITLGLLIAGALGAWVPDSFWQSFFLVGHPLLAKIWGPLIGPLVATAASVLAGYAVEIIFGVLGLIPSARHADVQMAHVSWNYTTFLNIAFLILAVVLVVRFVRTGGRQMLAMMGGDPQGPTS